jgi:hypothetical protein
MKGSVFVCVGTSGSYIFEYKEESTSIMSVDGST